MTRSDGESIVGKKLQDAVRCLVAEEYYAYQLYFMSRLAVRPGDRPTVSELFAVIAADEMDDHMKTLIEWCSEYGVEFPCTEKDFKKHARAAVQKQVSALKKNQDAGYYIREALKSEELAMAAYRQVLDMPETCEFTDLQGALWKIYYDEAEHLANLRTAGIAYDANSSLIIS
jgi:ferritin-like protein